MSAIQTPLTTKITYIVSEIEAQAPGTLGEKGEMALAYVLISSALVGPTLAGFI